MFIQIQRFNDNTGNSHESRWLALREAVEGYAYTFWTLNFGLLLFNAEIHLKAGFILQVIFR